MKRDTLADLSVLFALFFLPWQTRWIYRELTIGGEGWEYGRLSLYAVEILIFAAAALRGRLRLSPVMIPFVRPAALLLAVAVISVSFSRDAGLAVGALPHVAAAVALFFLVADERTNPRHAAWAFVAGLVVPCALAWWQALAGTSPASAWLGLAAHDAAALGQSVVETDAGRLLRGYGTFPHPNVFGGYLAVGLVLLAWLSRGAKTHGTRLLMAAPSALLSSALILTFSRSAWLGAAAGFGALAWAVLAARRAAPHRAIPMAALSLAAALVTLVAFHSAAFTRLSFGAGQPGARLEAKSVEERAGSYAALGDVFFANPITGAGPGNYTVALAALNPGRPAWSYQPVHNAPLLAFAEGGLLLLLPAATFAAALRHFLRGRRATTDGLFAVALLVALVPAALLDHYLWSLWPGLALAASTLALALRGEIS
jgi:hypothetical protein